MSSQFIAILYEDINILEVEECTRTLAEVWLMDYIILFMSSGSDTQSPLRLVPIHAYDPRLMA